MEIDKIGNGDFIDHTSKCRFCFDAFVNAEDRLEITAGLRETFKSLCQTELLISNAYSKDICTACKLKIESHALYRQHLIGNQKKLYKFVLEQEFTECIDDEEEYPADNSSPASYETRDEFYIVDDEGREFVVCTKDEAGNNSSDPESDFMQDERDEVEEEAVKAHKSNIKKRRIAGKLGDTTCPHCNVRIVVQAQLKRHIERVHLKIKNYNCDQCDYACYFKYSLDNHMEKHNDKESRRTFACDKCDHVTVSAGSLQKHKLVHLKIDTKLHECPICSEEFDSYNKLYRHKLKEHESADKMSCTFCEKTFKTNAALKSHINLYHAEIKPSFACTVFGCTKTFLTKRLQQNHVKRHDSDPKEVCAECGIQVVNKFNLEKHIKRVHLKERNFACDICDYRGFFKFNIVEHMKKHLDITERDRFYCDLCRFQSVSKSSMRTHKRTEHSGVKKTWHCHCGKVFNQNSTYYTHIKMVHEKLKPHECQHCPKAFFDKSQLRNHFKAQHLKQKDIPCEVCQKMFSTRKHLQSHMKYHAAPQFICQYENCSNAFYTPAQLKSHIKVHKNIRDFKCSLCEKSYFHKSHLKKHQLTHVAS